MWVNGLQYSVSYFEVRSAKQYQHNHLCLDCFACDKSQGCAAIHGQPSRVGSNRVRQDADPTSLTLDNRLGSPLEKNNLSDYPVT